jgi:hypothetical protein
MDLYEALHSPKKKKSLSKHMQQAMQTFEQEFLSISMSAIYGFVEQGFKLSTKKLSFPNFHV